MDMTFKDLVKMPLTKLKEYALTVDGINGVHSMKKQDLIEEICKIKGIVNAAKQEAEQRKADAHTEIQKIKINRKTIRNERSEKKATLSDDEKSKIRLQLKKLKRETRRLSKV